MARWTSSPRSPSINSPYNAVPINPGQVSSMDVVATGTNLSYQSEGGSIVNNVIQGTTGLQGGSQFGHTPLASNIGNREIQFALKLIW